MSKKSEQLDKLGTAMKEFERVEASRRCPPGKPLIVRLDGRAFHTFTRGLHRPFDPKLTELMKDTTAVLVKELQARIGYTQSDEITLVWYVPENSESEYIFGGRYQKLVSISAAMATAVFNKLLPNYLPTKSHLTPLFDSRAWCVDNLQDACLCLLWRKFDAVKNSISMVAQAHLSHKTLHKKGSAEKLQMLRDLGDPWENYAESYRQGSFYARVTEYRELTQVEIDKIPEMYRPTGMVERSSVQEISGKLLNENMTNDEILEFFQMKEANAV